MLKVYDSVKVYVKVYDSIKVYVKVYDSVKVYVDANNEHFMLPFGLLNIISEKKPF